MANNITYHPSVKRTGNENNDYPNIDGADTIADSAAYIANTTFSLGSSADNTVSDGTASFLGDTFPRCSNNDGCYYECRDTASCYNTNITCSSTTGCIVNCTGNLACSLMSLSLNENAKFHMECHESACTGMDIQMDENVVSAHIHCAGEDACLGMQVTVPAMGNETNVSISCYDLNSCTDLNITAGDEHLQLHMFKYSAGIVLQNGFGWSLSDQTITCDMNNTYIAFEFDTMTDGAIVGLIAQEYLQEAFPCAGVTVYCGDAVDGVEDGSCQMQYAVNGDGLSQYEDEQYRNDSGCI